MKRFSNPTSEMKSVTFEDGSVQFLMRGQSIETEKEVKKYDDGLRVSEMAVKSVKKVDKENS